MSKPERKTRVGAALCMLLAACLVARAQDFNLSRDFETNSNPGGVWSYGWETVLSSNFTLVTQTGQGFADNDVPYEAWALGSGVGPLFIHFPLSNTQSGTSDGGQGVYPPGTVVYYAAGEGAPENYAIIRFTAPSNGVYQVNVRVRHYLVGPSAGNTDFHVLSKNIPVLDRFLPVRSRSGYAKALRLAAGTTLDFAVGRGADNIQYGSGLNIRATITPVVLPLITQQPQNVRAILGKEALFAVSAHGEKLRYQWYFNGERIQNATQRILRIRPVLPRNAGSYSVRVSNSAGAIWSSPAVLSVQLGYPR